jgi:hypothetical protein
VITAPVEAVAASDTNWFFSPGFGGLAALMAALITAAIAYVVSRHRKDSETKDRTRARDADREDQNDRAQVRWWDRFVWVTDRDNNMELGTRIEMLFQLTMEAGPLSRHLVKLAQTWTAELYREFSTDAH